MIPYILIVLGIVLIGWAIIGFVRLLFLPFNKMTSVVFKRKDDFLKYESKEGRRFFKSNLKSLIWVYTICFVLGVVMFFAGMFLGYAAKGPNFWFYESVFGEEERPDYWEQISKDGKFIDKKGNEHKYYIIIEGDSFIFCGDECEDVMELQDKIEAIDHKNTVILIDDYAVASKYREAEKLLKEKAISYETERE